MAQPTAEPGGRLDKARVLCMWRCSRCQTVEFAAEKPPTCWCGSKAWKQLETLDQDESSATARTLADLPEPTWVRVPTGLADLDQLLGGGLCTPSTVLVWGPRGSGKTTLALRCVATLRTVLVAWEMSAGLYRYTAERSGASVKQILVAPAGSSVPDWIELCHRRQATALVVDSLGKTREPAALLSQLHDATNRADLGLVLAVAHATRDGDARGGPVLEHEADTCISVEPGLVAVVKNRFGPTAEVRVEWPPR